MAEVERLFFEMPGEDKFNEIEICPDKYTTWTIERGKRSEDIFVAGQPAEQQRAYHEGIVRMLTGKGYRPATRPAASSRSISSRPRRAGRCCSTARRTRRCACTPAARRPGRWESTWRAISTC